MHNVTRILLPFLALTASVGAMETLDYSSIWRTPGIGLQGGYRYESFRNHTDAELKHTNALGFGGSFLFGLIRTGFGFDLGISNPGGRLLLDTTAHWNRNVGTVRAYLETGLVLPLMVTYIEPFVRLGTAEFSVVTDNGPPTREADLGASSFVDFGIRSVVPYFLRDDGLVGLGIAFGQRNFRNERSPHYQTDALFIEVSVSATGWFVRGK